MRVCIFYNILRIKILILWILPFSSYTERRLFVLFLLGYYLCCFTNVGYSISWRLLRNQSSWFQWLPPPFVVLAHSTCIVSLHIVVAGLGPKIISFCLYTQYYQKYILQHCILAWTPVSSKWNFYTAALTKLLEKCRIPGAVISAPSVEQ